MATRSFIGILNSDKSVDYIYCHYDGYPEHNGVLLNDYYNDEDTVRDLISLGDLSVLAPKISAPEGVEHSFDNRVNDVCVFYGRDRGEDGVGYKKTTADQYFSNNFGESSWVDYVYLFEPSYGWKVKDGDEAVSVMEFI